MRRCEYFRNLKYQRICYRVMNRFRFQISYSMLAQLTLRTIAVVKAFRFGIDEESNIVLDAKLKMESLDVVSRHGHA